MHSRGYKDRFPATDVGRARFVTHMRRKLRAIGSLAESMAKCTSSSSLIPVAVAFSVSGSRLALHFLFCPRIVELPEARGYTCSSLVARIT